MSLPDVLLGLSVLVFLQGLYSLSEGVRSRRFFREYRRPPVATWPRVLVVCPCRGVDDGFEGNIRSILNQDYPTFAVRFVVDSTSDAAFEVLRQCGATDIVIAGVASGRGQKVHNLIRAVETPHESEILAFCDADARFPKSWLRELVAPLCGDSPLGATTGYRWYVPDPVRFATLLRSCWNATVLSLLGPHHRNFAWGGSMAIRREVFDRIGVRSRWDAALSDDFALTDAVERAGMNIAFVPTCLVPSSGDLRFGGLLEFTTRQMVITRVYRPRLWKLAFASQTAFNVAFFSLIAVILFTGSFAAASLWTGIFVLAALKAYTRLQTIRGSSIGPMPHGWFYVLSPPLVALLQQYNLIRSAWTREVTWRGIAYTLVSPFETRVRERREHS